MHSKESKEKVKCGRTSKLYIVLRAFFCHKAFFSSHAIAKVQCFFEIFAHSLSIWLCQLDYSLLKTMNFGLSIDLFEK